MADYFRPSFPEKTEKEFNKFLDNHPELPLRTPKELMLFATRKFIYEVEQEEEIENISAAKLNQIAKMLRED